MIRPATQADAKAIAILAVNAMQELARQFCASNDVNDAINLFERFIATEGNQYSYGNTLVYLIDNEIAGAISGYNGGEIASLRKPFFSYIEEKFHPDGFKMEYESEAGEFYIDTISVSPLHQGKGIGKSLIKAMLDKAKAEGHPKAGLLVDVGNPNAERLYQSLGFKNAGEKMLLGKTHRHLIYAF